MTENCIEQLNKIGDLAGKIGQSADSRVQHLSKNLDAILANGNQKFQAAKTGAEMFDALDSTKKELYNAYKGINTNLNPHYDMVKKDMETLYNSFRTNLEGVNVWGKAGDFQKNLNKAVATFIPSAKAARKAGFITNITGKETINPGTVKTFINQSLNETGSPQLRQTILGNHIEASNGLINAVNESRSIAGLDALPNLSESPVLKEAMSESSMGKQFADLFMKKAMTSGLAGVTGGAIGSALGHPFIGYFVGKQALTPMFKHIMPNMLNKLFANSTSAAGFKAGSSYLQAVVKGAAKTEEAIVAAASGEKLSLVSKSENKVDDLKKVVDGFEQNPDLVNQLPADLGHYLPEHNSALVASATKTISYLSSLKVRTPNTLPFDGKFVASKEQDARYESALKIANNPLSVLDKVRSGQITPNDIADLNAMAPALADRLRQGLTTQLVSNKQAGKSVPYKTQLGMSLFLGQPLASSMQSFSIQASQPAMAAPNQPAKSVKNGDKLSKMPNLYQTSDQSRQLSRQNRK